MAVELGQAFVHIRAITEDMQRDIAKALDGTGKLGDKAGKDIGKGISDQVKSSTKGITNSFSKELGSIDEVGSTAGKGFSSKFKNSVKGTGKESGEQVGAEFEKPIKESSEKASHWFRNAFTTGAIGGAVGAVTAQITSSMSSLAGEALEASDATDKFKATLDFAGLDSSKIEEVTARAQKYADQTVYGLGDIQNMTAQLAANGVKDYSGLAEAAGNLNAIAGGNAETFKSVGMAMSQTAGAGKLTTENFNQIANVIPGASGKIQEALKDAGAYTGDFRDAMADGQITAEEFNQAVMELGNEPVAVEAAKSVDTFEGAIGNLEATISGNLAKALTAAKPFLTGLINGFNGFAEKVMPLVGHAFSAIPGVIENVKGAFERFGQIVEDNKGKLIGIAAAVSPILIPLMVGLAARWTAAGVAATVSAAKQVAAWISTKIEAVKSGAAAVLNLWKLGAAWITTGVQATIGAAKQVAAWVIVRAQSAGAAIASLASLAGGWIKAGIQATVNAAKIAASWIVAMGPIGWAISAIVAIGSALWAFFTKTETGRELWQKFTDGLKAAWETFTTWLSSTWESITTGFSTAWETIKTVFFDLWNGAVDGIKGAWQGFTDWISTAWDTITTAFSNGWGAVKGAFFDLWTAAVDGVKNTWNTVTGAVSGAWETLKTAFSNGWNFIKTVFILAWQREVNGLKNIWNTVVNALSAIWETLKTAFNNGWQFIQNVVFNPFKAAINLVKAVFSGNTDAMKAAWDGFKDAIHRAIETIKSRLNGMVNAFREIPGKIKSAFANAGTWLLDAGRSIISGLADGIRNAGSAVMDAIRAVVPDSVERFVPGLHFGGLLPGYARGGVLPSIPGVSNSERDPILGWSTEKKQPIARVEPGEFVVNRAATKKFLPLLAAINGGKLNSKQGDWGLPGFANGGVVGFNDVMKFLRGGTVNGNSAPGSLEGSPYVWGGGLDGNWGDCSGTQSAIAALVSGVDTTGRKFATGSQGAWLGAHGFKRGRSNGKDAFETAYFNGGPWGGHTAGTLFDSNGKAINVEMGGGRGNGQIGGPAAGSRNSQFTDIWWHPLKSAVASALTSKKSKITSTSVDGATVETSEGTQEVDWGSASGLFELAKRGVRLFDTGGLWRSGTLGFNAGPNEHVMSPAQWDKLVEGLKAVADAVKTGNLSYKWIAERFDKRTSELTMEATGGALGGWTADTKLLQDAEKALIETRKKATAENEDVKKAEEKLAKVREDTARDVKLAKEQNKGKKDEDKKNKAAQESAAKKVRKAELELEDARKKATTSTGEYAEEMRAAEAAVAAARKASLVKGFDNGANLKSFAEHGSLSDYAEVTNSVGGLMESITPLSGLGKVMSGLAGSASSVLKSTDSLKTAYTEQADANAAVVGAEADLKAARMEGDAGKIAESEKALTKARSVASKAAVAAGHAEIAAAISVATAVVDIISSIIEWIDDKIQAVFKGMTTAWSAISSAMGDVAKLAGVAEKLRNQVSGLVIDAAMAAIAVKATGREMRLAHMDAAIAGIEATVSVAEAQAAFDAQRKADMRAAMTNYNDLSLAYDRFRNGMTDANGEVMDELVAWSDASHKLYSQLLAAQVNQQIVQRQGEKAALEAAYKHTLAVLDLQNATLSLNVAAQKLAVASNSAFGMDQVGATVGQRYSELMAEKAKLQANNANIGTWINPVNWFTTMPAANRRLQQIDEQLKQLEAMDEFKKLDPGALSDMQKTVGQAGWMGFFGAGDQIEGMIKNSALGDAGRALEEIDFKNSLIDIQAEQAEARAKIERAMAELEQKSKIDALDTEISGLEREKASHDAWAEYWGTTNEDVRKALADLAKTNADFATELKEKSREPQTIQLYGDSFDRDGTAKLLESLGYRVEKLENPSAASGDVVASRR